MPALLPLLDRAKEAEILLWRTVLPDRFLRLEVETSTRCNRRCAFCPVATAPRPDHRMEEDLFFSILDQAAQMGFRGRFSPHFYGEPLLDPRLPRLVEETRRHLPGARVVIYTNGDLLTPDLARSLLDAGTRLFIVTFEEEESEAFRRTRAVLSPWTLKRRFLVRHFARDVLEPYNRGGAVRLPGRRRSACFAAASTLVVDAWGRVRLCFNDYQGEVIWGDLTKERLADVWRKPEYVQLRHDLLHGVFTTATCRACAGLDAPPSPAEPTRGQPPWPRT
ncbi:MAG: radical SAM protein [Deltaproteobacteria bacterium]|nr:radical SAM protein [Deltaproteobacteria bacterium]